MKKTYLYLVLLALAFTACEKDDNRIFTESADARLNKVIAEYQQQLLSSPNGWKAVITPGNETSYNFFFKFKEGNRVVMYGDFDSTTAGTGKESSYRLKALQQPSLIFDTYSHLHILADPDERVNGGVRGGGLFSDFEFAFDSIAGDTIKLYGRVNNTKLNLVKATAQEAADWENKNWEAAIKSVANISKILNYFKRMTVAGIEYEIIVNPFNRTVIITWIDAGGVKREFISDYKYSASPSGITFTTPFNTGNSTIPGLYGITFDATTMVVNLNVGNNTPATIAGAIKPISPDLTSPSRWWNEALNANTYYANGSGFTVNGVSDAFGYGNVPGLQFVFFYPRWDVTGGIVYDLFGFYTGAIFGPVTRPPTFTTDGRVIFPLLGTLPTVPASAATAVANTRTLLTDPAGFYLVQTGPDTYDMVSAKDAKAWISWQLVI